MKTTILSFFILLLLFSCKDKNVPEPTIPDCKYITDYQFKSTSFGYCEEDEAGLTICYTVPSFTFRYNFNYIKNTDLNLLKSVIEKKYEPYIQDENLDNISFSTDTIVFNSYNDKSQLIKEIYNDVISSFTYNQDNKVETCTINNSETHATTILKYHYSNNKLSQVLIDDKDTIDLFYENNSLRPTKIIRKDQHEIYYRSYDHNNNLIQELYLDSDKVDDPNLAIINYTKDFLPNTSADINFQELFFTSSKNELRKQSETNDESVITRIPFLDIHSNKDWTTTHTFYTKVNDNGYLEGNQEGAKVTYLCE